MSAIWTEQLLLVWPNLHTPLDPAKSQCKSIDVWRGSCSHIRNPPWQPLHYLSINSHLVSLMKSINLGVADLSWAHSLSAVAGGSDGETNKGPSTQSYGFPSRHVRMWELDHKEGQALKNWCFQTIVVEKTLERPLDNKEIKPVNPKGNQPWIFIGRIDAEVEAPKLWPPDAKSRLILGKTLMLGKTEGRRRRGWQRMRWLDSITNSRDMNLSKLWEIVEGRGDWRAAVHGVTELDNLEQQQRHLPPPSSWNRFWI